MARTAGAVSNIDICSHTLISLIGGTVEDNTPKIMVTVSARWLQRFQQPGSEFVAITAQDYESFKEGNGFAPSVESGQSVAQPINRPSVAIVED